MNQMKSKWVWITLALILVILMAFSIYFVNIEEPASNYELEVQEKRAEKDYFLQTHPQTSLPSQIKLVFQGLAYFDVDEKWKIKTFLERKIDISQKPPEQADTSLKLAGLLHFNLDGKSYQLKAFWYQPDNFKQLFVPFRDLTNGKGTYAGGRYINTSFSDRDSLELDFNRAYNPLCAYNPMNVCPLPPPENNIPILIEAGEKQFPLAHLLH